MGYDVVKDPVEAHDLHAICYTCSASIITNSVIRFRVWNRSSPASSSGLRGWSQKFCHDHGGAVCGVDIIG